MILGQDGFIGMKNEASRGSRPKVGPLAWPRGGAAPWDFLSDAAGIWSVPFSHIIVFPKKWLSKMFYICLNFNVKKVLETWTKYTKQEIWLDMHQLIQSKGEFVENPQNQLKT
jgi:hypothetical protein